MRFLNSKPRRSLYRLRLKFEETTAEVSRKYYVLTNLSTCTHDNKYVYLRKCLPRTYFGEYDVLISCCCYRRAPTGRYSCIAQGASPGLINGTHLLSPFRGGTPLSPTNAPILALLVPLLIGAHIICCLCLPRVPFRALPSFPLGFAEYRAYGTRNAPGF